MSINDAPTDYTVNVVLNNKEEADKIERHFKVINVPIANQLSMIAPNYYS